MSDDHSEDDSFYKIEKKEEEKKLKIPEIDNKNYTKSFEKRFSKLAKQKEANKEIQEKAKILNMDIFIESCDHSAPTDFMNWYLSKINTVLCPSSIVCSNSVKEPSQEDNLEIEEEHTNLSLDMSYQKDKYKEHYPYFESVKISTMTWKGGNKSKNVVGELITPETKVNCYMGGYHIIMCLDFSSSMNIIDTTTGEMYFDKMKKVITATLFNLKCSIQKNDKVNKNTFTFEPKIYLTIIGCGLPDLVNIGQYNEHICKEDIIETALPILLFNQHVDPDQIWKLLQRVNSQVTRVVNLIQKVSSKISYKY